MLKLPQPFTKGWLIKIYSLKNILLIPLIPQSIIYLMLATSTISTYLDRYKVVVVGKPTKDRASTSVVLPSIGTTKW